MRAGVRAWIFRSARGMGPALHSVSPTVMLSLMSAAAFAPMLTDQGVIGGAATAVSAVGGGVLSDLALNVVERLRGGRGDGAEIPQDAAESEIALQIEALLQARGEDARILRSEIAAILRQIDVGSVVVTAAIEAGNEQLRANLIAMAGELGDNFTELRFLLSEMSKAAASLHGSLDLQDARFRAIIDQNGRQLTEIRLTREAVASIERQAGSIYGLAGPDARQAIRWAGGSPYRGLLPFGEADADVFYGRERLTADLIGMIAGRLVNPGIVIVTGASGAGKSSLLRAGLLPALARGIQLEGSSGWPRIVMTPADDPLTELASHLSVLTAANVTGIRDSLAAHPDQAHLIARQAVATEATRPAGASTTIEAADRRLVLVVDQFEQVFTLNQAAADAAGVRAFITALSALALRSAERDARPAALVIIAVRGDYWNNCAARPELAAALKDGQFVVGPMTESDIRMAITGPAETASLKIEAPLVDLIVGDLRTMGGEVAAGALPLLSQAMLLTWESREGNQLTSRGYAKSGGVTRAVQASADAAYDGLQPHEQAVAREILRSMTVANRDNRPARRPVKRADLYASYTTQGRTTVDKVLEAFASRRLLVLNDDSVQISHDALLSAWSRLRGWLEEDQASWILHSQLADDVTAWQEADKDTSFLYRGTQLAALQLAAAAWDADPERYPAFSGIQRDFLSASKRAAARVRRQRRLLAASLVVLLLAAISAAVIAASAAKSANRQRAISASAELATQSEVLDSTDPVTAAQLAAAAWHFDQSAQARDSLLDVAVQPERAALPATGGGVIAMTFSPDGRILADIDGRDVMRLWSVTSHKEIGKPVEAEVSATGQPDALEFEPGGKYLAIEVGGNIRILNIATRQSFGSPITVSGDFAAMSFSADGNSIVTASTDGIVRTWDVAQVEHHQLGAAIHLPAGFIPMSFSPGGRVLATVKDNSVYLWTLPDGTEMGGPIPTGGQQLQQVAFSPDGSMLATLNEDGATVWNTARGSLVSQFREGSSGMYHYAAFSPDDTTLAVIGEGGTILWNLIDGQRVGTLTTNTGLTSAVAFRSDSRFLATGSQNGERQLWDVAVWRDLRTPIKSKVYAGIGENSAFAFTQKGAVLAALSPDRGLSRWRISSRSRRISSPFIPTANASGYFAVDSAGKTAAISDGDNGTLRLWKILSGRQRGKALVVPGDDVGAPVNAIAFSKDDREVAAEAAGVVAIWDVASHRMIGKPIRIDLAEDSSTCALSFSPDGNVIETADIHKAALWDIATGHRVGQFVIGPPWTPSGDFVTVLSFSGDGKRLATSKDGEIRIWNMEDQQEIGAPLNPGAGRLVGPAIALNPDGELIAGVSGRKSVRVWDVRTHQQIGAAFSSGPARRDIFDVKFSPDGRTLATMDIGSLIRLWDVSLPENPVDAACRLAGENISRTKWSSYIQSEPFQQVCA